MSGHEVGWILLAWDVLYHEAYVLNLVSKLGDPDWCWPTPVIEQGDQRLLAYTGIKWTSY